MRNAVGVWSTAVGAGTLLWGATGSAQVAAIVAGAVLTLASAGLLIDVDDDHGQDGL